jgi:hypothetical protein
MIDAQAGRRRQAEFPRRLDAPMPGQDPVLAIDHTGLVNPKRRMLSAICRTCLREWVRTLRGQGRNWSMGSPSRAWAIKGISCQIHIACL